jgi:hypothetical protein
VVDLRGLARELRSRVPVVLACADDVEETGNDCWDAAADRQRASKVFGGQLAHRIEIDRPARALLVEGRHGAPVHAAARADDQAPDADAGVRDGFDQRARPLDVGPDQIARRVVAQR